MARIIVITDQSERPDAGILLDERVCSVHLSDDHSAAQLVERLGWAIHDAEDADERTVPQSAGKVQTGPTPLCTGRPDVLEPDLAA